MEKRRHIIRMESKAFENDMTNYWEIISNPVFLISADLEDLESIYDSLESFQQIGHFTKNFKPNYEIYKKLVTSSGQHLCIAKPHDLLTYKFLYMYGRMISASPKGAHASAFMYSLVESATAKSTTTRCTGISLPLY